MKNFYGLWITTLVIALGFSGQAVLDDEISFGGGLENPKVRLTKGDEFPLDVAEGGTLTTSCFIESGNEDDFTFSWVKVTRDGQRIIISNNKDLTIQSVGTDIVNEPIFCEVERLEDGDTFDRQLRVRLTQQRQPRTLEITPMETEDKERGYIVRKCNIVPPPPANEPWTITWYDPNGRVAPVRDILTVTVTGKSGIGKYTCEARNDRTNDILRGEFTIQASRVPGPSSENFNTQIEPITSQLEFGKPYEARCFVNPRPREPLDYIWYFRGREMARGERVRIGQFNRMTSGEYTCEPRSMTYDADRTPFANATLGLRLKASVEDHTELRPPPGSTLITYLGETRELHCEISQYSKSPVRWYFNGAELNYNNPVNNTGNVKRVDFLRVSILTLDGVTENQEGQYECRTDDATKVVDVIVLTDYDVEVNPPLYVVDEGEHVEIHCSVQGGRAVPNYELQWFFRPVGSNRRIPIDFNSPGGFVRTDDQRALRTSVISKFKAMFPDEGEYICKEPRGQEGVSTLQIRKVTKDILRISPGIIRVRPGQTVVVSCYAITSDGSTRGRVPNLRVFDSRLRMDVSPGDQEGTIRGSIQRIDSTFNGTVVECYSEDKTVEPVTAIIYVEDVCPPGYRRCRNGRCLEAGRFCDGISDSEDNCDEEPEICLECDPIAIRCQPFGGMQPRKQTYMIHWQCDGEDDCGNGFDEASCTDPSIASCNEQTYSCPGSNLQIPRSFICDKDPDCSRGNDEDGCIEPQILDMPKREYTQRRGERVELRCEVAGHPSPRVIWRFNWGCLREEGSRMTVRNTVEGCGTAFQRVISTLTINNFTPGDDGIYNCEGLNGMKRAMSHDYLVIFRD